VGVPKELLATHTAVSAEVAQAMAKGGLSRCPADVVVSITGVAGPEPDEDGNPVGMVCIAVARRGELARDFERRYGEIGRDAIRERAVYVELFRPRGLIGEAAAAA